MTQPTNGSTRAPAYVSFAAFTRFIDWIAGLSEVPAELPRSQWPRTLQGGTGLQLAAAVRFLGLFDGDRPTATLRRVAVKDAAARSSALAALVSEVYGTAFVGNLASATLQDVDRHLQSLGTTNSTHRRAVSFFINAARAAGIELPAEVSRKARIRRPAGAKAKPAATKTATPERRGRSKANAAAPASAPATATSTSTASAPRKRGRPPGSKNRKSTPPAATPVSQPTPRAKPAPAPTAATVPAESVDELRIKYIETLMARLEAAPDALDGKLLDRIERLLGFTAEAE